MNKITKLAVHKGTFFTKRNVKKVPNMILILFVTKFSEKNNSKRRSFFFFRLMQKMIIKMYTHWEVILRYYTKN